MKKFLASVSAFLLSVSSLSLLFTGHAYAASRTWNGSAGDHKLTTAGNWVGGVAPSASDDLIFPYGAGVTDKSPVDDFADDTSFSSIVFSGVPAGGELDYNLSGNRMAISIGVTVTSASGSPAPTVSSDLVFSSDTNLNAGGNSLVLDGVISGAGNITKAGQGNVYLDGDNTFTGTLDVNGGSLTANTATALGAASAGTSVNDGADLYISSCNSSLTVAEPLTLSGNSSDTSGDFPTPKLTTSTGSCSGGAGFDENYGFNANTKPVILSGNITMGSNVTFGSFSSTSLTGHLSGSYKFNLIAGYSGKLTVKGASNSTGTSNGTYTPAAFTKTLSDSQSSNTVGINGNAVITITGTRGDINIDGGTLKGTGTVGLIGLIDGVLAPGMSPGVLNSGNLTASGGSYQAQLGGTSAGQFDQVNVTGTVSLGTNTSLDASLYNGYKPVVGNSFMLIKNDGSDAVSGHFKGLTEGATFKVSGYSFKISYKAGTGNDVVITVTALPPKAPDTGIAFIKQNPLLALVLLGVVTPTFAFAANRSNRRSRR
ncbi:MAG: hypothetical protein ACXWLH_00460 [Candidatus Saccharimonadales bacterium]